MATRRVLVTGASGFIGRNVINVLRGYSSLEAIAATSRTGHPEGGGERWTTLDIADRQALEKVLVDLHPTHILNLAAYGTNPRFCDEGAAYKVNQRAVLDMIDLAGSCGIKRIVQAGSCFEYGPQVGRIAETALLRPMSPYAITKAAAGALGLDRARAVGVDFVVARIFGIWGRHEPKHRLVPTIMAGKASGLPIKLSAGQQVRDMSYASEVAATLVEILLQETALQFDVVNVGTGTGLSVRDFAREVARLLGCESLLEFGAVPLRSHEVPSLVADVSRLKQIGVSVPTVDLDRHVHDLLQWNDGEEAGQIE